jgi:hypothetical protein
MNTNDTAVVLNLRNLSAAFTEKSTEVWCDFANQVAATNENHGTYFCQLCGSTTSHEKVTS